MPVTTEDHSLQTTVHRAHRWEYADAAARLAGAGFVATDVGKHALQLDTHALWLLTDEAPVTWFKFAGPPVVVIKVADYAFDANEDDVVISNSAGARTYTLPPGADRGARPYTLKNINTGIATWEGDGAETIDGEPSVDLAERDSLTIVWTGTGWESI
jgi:hypothetical protein